MANKESIISNSSYTNKDFQSIYPALLDLVKKITYRWDPSISNESDPGVILLKLNALIADKCNYNIDKNVLECFPLSVTQERNARQLFEQLGYYMHWYLAAEGPISMRWIAETPTGITNYSIPQFTMVTDEDASVVYTIIDDLPLLVDGSYVTYNALQGTVTDYSLNGSNLITAQNLDNNNRLYFQESNIAQNGIFIRNSSTLNYSEWVRKDNLTVETVSSTSKNYKFGVTLDTNICYIEFPTNAEELIGDGIYIKYIKTDGYSGNIAPFVISKFYNNVQVESTEGTILLNSDNVQITNFSAIVNGEDTESINDAYQGYKKVVGTFDTLVTLRDYINAVRRIPFVSNGFVTDRTDDINTSANIMQIINEVDQRNSVPVTYQNSSGDAWEMLPYTLNLTMLYARDEYSDITSTSDFNNTFRLLDDIDLERNTSYVSDAKAYLEDEKHVQQEFINPSYVANNAYLLPNSLCFLKNKYRIDVKVTPQYKLTSTQIEEIQNNIRMVLLNNLNSRKIEFGEEIEYDIVYDLIMGSDERIKAISLDDITYETYAVVFEVNGADVSFNEYRIDNGYTPEPGEATIVANLRNTIIAKNVLAGKTPFWVTSDIYPQFHLDQKDGTLRTNVTYAEITGEIPLVRDSSDSTTGIATVEDNTVCRFYAPNLIVTDTYGSYVKYEYSLNNDVEAGNSYRLSSNEYVAFYWSGGEDSGYNYAVYGEGTIISPVSTLIGQTVVVDSETLPAILQSKLNEADIPKKISGVTYELATIDSSIGDHIQKLANNGWILSNANNISIQVMNQVSLDNSYYCAWITSNRTVDRTCILFDAAQGSKILGQNEYFMYTNAQKSALVILGQGTKLTRDVTEWSSVWECPEFDYSDIVSDGLDALVEKQSVLQKVPADAELTVTEMKYIALPPGSQIRFTNSSYPSTGDLPSFELNHPNGYILDDSYTNISYKSAKDTAYTTLPINYVEGSTDLGWTLDCVSVLDLKPDVPVQLTENQQFVVNSDAATASGLWISSNKDIYGEQGVSFLPEDEVTLLVFDRYDNQYWDSPTNNYSKVIYSADGDEATLTFNYNYNSQSSQQIAVVVNTLNSSSEPVNCLLSIDTTSVPVGVNNLTLTYRIDSGATVTLQPNDVYSIELEGSGNNSTSTITFAVSGLSSTVKVVTLKLSRFKPVEKVWSDPDIENTIDTIIAAQGAHKKEFDWSYAVDEDELVEDPLNPNSFFDFNHEYNKFTIAQLDTDSLYDGIYVTNKVR